MIMPIDLNTHETPPGGWCYRQSATGWSAPTPVGSTYSQTVTLIIQHRLKNPAIVAKHHLSTDPAVVGEELMDFNRLRLGIPKPQPAPMSFSHPSSMPGRVAAAAVEIKTAARGTAVLLDWLTSGGQPVAKELAEARAKVCVACPFNVEGTWFTVAPAEIIRSTLSARSDLKLETPYDDQLKSCGICKCLNRLKPHVPLDHILKKTAPDIMASFPENCWIARRDK
jgi:hypothetical protein